MNLELAIMARPIQVNSIPFDRAYGRATWYTTYESRNAKKQNDIIACRARLLGYLVHTPSNEEETPGTESKEKEKEKKKKTNTQNK
jgi:hypothetical protein